MKIGTEDKKKLTIAIVVGVLGLASVVWIYSQLATPDVPVTSPAPAVVKTPAVATPAVATPAVAAPAASNASSTGGSRVELTVAGSGSGAKKAEPVSMDPTLRMGSMLLTEALVYSGSGRNIFSATSVPVEIPKAIAPARKVVVAPPPVVVQQGPPPPPPIDLKFFGTATAANGTRQAFLLHGEDVALASAGDVVLRRYKVVSIAASSIVVEDMTNNNRQTLPLIAN